MSQANSLYRSMGARSLPIADTTDLDVIGALDPARRVLLDLFEAALNAELTPAWSHVIAGTSLAAVATPVGSKLGVQPDLENMRQVKQGFPVLSVVRTDDERKTEQFTLQQSQVTCKWEVEYVLGPLEVGGQTKLQAVLDVALDVVVGVIKEGGHRAYGEDTNQGVKFAKRVLGPGTGCCGFSEITVTGGRAGAASIAKDGPKYLAMTVALETKERSRYLEPLPTFTGARVKLSTGDSSGIIPELVTADTNFTG